MEIHKFKPGDKVVFVKSHDPICDVLMGATATIVEYYNQGKKLAQGYAVNVRWDESLAFDKNTLKQYTTLYEWSFELRQKPAKPSIGQMWGDAKYGITPPGNHPFGHLVKD